MGLDQGQVLFPQGGEGVALDFLAGGLRQGAPLVLVFQVVLQEALQVAIGVVNALAAVGEEGGGFAVLRLLEEQGARSGGLEGAAVTLAADAAVEDDASPPQEGAVGVPVGPRVITPPATAPPPPAAITPPPTAP